MFTLVRQRKTDIWNERAAEMEGVMEVKVDEFADNIAHNNEGISADRAKWPLNQTNTPKVLPPNKRS